MGLRIHAAPSLYKTGVCRIISALGGVFFSVLIGRMLGPEALGIFTFSISAAMLLILLTKHGQDKLLTKQTSILFFANSFDLLRVLIRRAVRRSAVISCGFFALVVLVPLEKIGDFISADEVAVLRILIFAVPIAGISWILSGFFKGIHKTHIGVLLETGAFYAAASVVLLPFLFLPFEVGINWIASCFVIGCCIVLALALSCYKRVVMKLETPPSPSAERTPNDNRLSNHSFLPFLFIDVSNFLMQSGSFLLGGIFLSEIDLGLLRASERIVLLIAFVISITNAIVMPRIASAFANNDFNNIVNHGRWAVKINILLSLPIAVVVFTVPTVVLSIFGHGFEEAYIYIWIMGAGQMINVVIGPAAIIMSMTGKERIVLMINFFGLIIACVGFPVASLCFGGIGFAVCYFGLIILKNTACLYTVWKTMRVWYIPIPFFLTRND